MKHWHYEVWNWRGRWETGMVEASTMARALALAIRAVPEYRDRLPRRNLQVGVRITRLD